MDYTAHASSPECQQECMTLDEVTKTRKEFVRSAIDNGNERKNDLLQETRSSRSSSQTSSASSAAVRAQARADLAMSLKRAEMQKRRSQIESQSALLLEQEELALARKRERVCQIHPRYCP